MQKEITELKLRLYEAEKSLFVSECEKNCLRIRLQIALRMQRTEKAVSNRMKRFYDRNCGSTQWVEYRKLSLLTDTLKFYGY